MYKLSDDEETVVTEYSQDWKIFANLFQIEPRELTLEEARLAEIEMPGTVWSFVNDFASTGSGSVSFTLEESIRPGVSDSADVFIKGRVSRDSDQGKTWNGIWRYTTISIACRFCDGQGETDLGDCEYCDGDQTIVFDLDLAKEIFER